jgi:hypothetical protein
MKPLLFLLSIGIPLSLAVQAQETLTFDASECAGMSGFRAHWDKPIPVTENGARAVKDSAVKDRGQTAVWDGVNPGPLAFDAVHRNLLVRFPGAAEKIAEAVASGKTIEKVELVLPYLDEEIWPQGRVDFPSPDGYRYRQNWNCDNYYRGQVREATRKNTPLQAYREERPNWHAVAHVLRKPWKADGDTAPTYNAAINGAVYWKRFGASDEKEDRFPSQLGPVEVSSYKPDGRMDVTAVVTDEAYGKTLGERLRLLSDTGFLVGKEEVYDARYFDGCYEWAGSTGPRAILIKQPKLIVTFRPGKSEKIALNPAADIPGLAAKHKDQPVGAPTAVVPTREEVARMNEKFRARPNWMPDWQYEHIKQLMSLETGGKLEPFYYSVAPAYVTADAIEKAKLRAGKKVEVPQEELDYAVYLSWLDWINGRPPRFWEGHLTAADNITYWYNFRDAMPAPVQDSVIRGWTAWLMPDRETAKSDKERKDFTNTTGQLIHPMADDPRVGSDSNDKLAVWGQGDTYYRQTGDWRGNKSYYRSGFTRMGSTANFNSSATSGALLNGQIVGSRRAIEDGRAGLMQFPFWQWTFNAGVGQEFIDHYYWAIASAGNKLFADFCENPQDKMAGWSIVQKTSNDLAMAYHPNLKKLLGPASRTYYEHVLGQQDGLYHILHTLSPKGVLSDLATGTLPALTSPVPDGKGRLAKPTSAWGHDYSPQAVALNSMTGRWGEPWISEWIDEKPLPWRSLAEKKVVADGDWVTTYFGENYGLTSIRKTPQRIHVLGHWRRKAEIPSGMRDIGTLDMRIGFNQTQIGDDGAGIITPQGTYRTYQHDNKLIMLARPNPKVIAEQAAAHPFGQGKAPAQDIKSVQCTAALFNFEEPSRTWQIFVDGKKVNSLPASAKYGQVITVRDGVTYLAIRPLPTEDLGRDAEVMLEAGQPQTQAYHETTNIQPALLINANFFHREKNGAEKFDTKRLAGTTSGFVLEMGDEKEYGSFEKFQEHIQKAKLTGGPAESGYGVTYRSGDDTLVASWPKPVKDAEGKEIPSESPAFTVNGKDPAAYAKEQSLWQDTTLSQMGLGRRLEKSGALVERAAVMGNNPMMLQAFPKQKTYVCTNPVPGYNAYRLQTPDGIKISADGLCSMGQWAVKDGRELILRYAAFDLKPEFMPPSADRATALFVSGIKEKPKVILNDKEIVIKPWKLDGADGWLVALGETSPKDAELAARFAKMKAAIEVK